MGKCKRLLTVVLAAVLCCTTLPLTAFAGGGPEDGSNKVLEYWSQGTPSPQPTTPADPQQTGQPVPGTQQTPAQGEPLSPGSEFSTRDMLYDKDTHKQFITVEGRDGHTFYIVIDYDAPVNGKEEQYQTYFLNKVDEADLGADIRGNLLRIDNTLEKMPDRLVAVKAQLDNLFAQQEAAKAEVGKPFPQEDELRQKSARLAELDALLNIDGGHRHEEQAIAKCARPSVLDGLKRPAQPGSDKKTSKAVRQEL